MQLYIPTHVYSQPDCVRAHASALRALGTKAMIVTGRTSAKKTGALDDVLAALGETPYVIFDRIEENPSIETVMAAREIAAKAGADFFIGIGGGSPMDAAKAISLMAKNPHETAEVFYDGSRTLPHYPVACVPTTCGTGSEVTPYAILTRHTLRTKKGISHKVFPALALLDARYLRAMPRTGLVNTCVDALSHLLESCLNTGANELNRVYSYRGLALWARFRDRLLHDTLTDGDYETMLHASMVAGMAISHTGTSLPHGLSYPVTYALHIPHGRAVGMFLGGFVAHYGDQTAALDAVKQLGFDSTADFRIYMNQLLGPVDVPQTLLHDCAQRILADPAKLKNYPFPITEAELMALAN